MGDVFRVVPGSDQLSDYLGDPSVQDEFFFKKGGRYFSRNSLKRILFPFIVGVVIIGLLVSELFSIHKGELVDQTFWERS